MKRIAGLFGGLVLVLTLGVGTASADPLNGNTRYVYGVNCGGELVDFDLNMGAAAHDLNSSRVFQLMGATVNGVWVVPLAEPGQAKKDLTACSFTSLQGNAVVWYGKWKTGA
jgi:hypothetical protein